MQSSKKTKKKTKGKQKYGFDSKTKKSGKETTKPSKGKDPDEVEDDEDEDEDGSYKEESDKVLENLVPFSELSRKERRKIKKLKKKREKLARKLRKNNPSVSVPDTVGQKKKFSAKELFGLKSSKVAQKSRTQHSDDDGDDIQLNLVH